MPSPSDVNDRLNTLRGEHYRRTRNARGSRAQRLPNLSRHVGSLPLELATLTHDSNLTHFNPDPSRLTTPVTNYAGPEPPKSWRGGRNRHDLIEWRAQALSLIFSTTPDCSLFQSYYGKSEHKVRLPPLTLLCLKNLLSQTTLSEFVQLVIPHLPYHLRRELVRDAAIHMPLSGAMLFSLVGNEGHVAGELIVVGPAASLKETYLSPRPSTAVGHSSLSPEEVQSSDWDSEDSHELLNTLVLLSSPLSSSTLLRLPASITHMALIDLPTPIPLYKLPSQCPLLEVLDLSYNNWLTKESMATQPLYDKIDWSRWNNLKLLGLRGCFISDEIIVKLNKGRWDEVHVLL